MAKKEKAAPVVETPEVAEVSATPVATTGDKQFVHNKKLAVNGDYTPESKLTWHITKNPRAAGRATFDRFAKYFNTETVKAYTEAGGTKGDLLWDLRSGYLSIEGVTLGGELKARAPKAPPKPKADKAPRAPREPKAAAVKSAATEDVEAAAIEEVID